MKWVPMLACTGARNAETGGSGAVSFHGPAADRRRMNCTEFGGRGGI